MHIYLIYKHMYAIYKHTYMYTIIKCYVTFIVHKINLRVLTMLFFNIIGIYGQK